jgi:hypothetical protein
MPTKRSVRSRTTGKRLQPPTGLRGGSLAVVEVSRWWEQVRKQLKPRRRLSGKTPPCTVPLSIKSGSDLYYHDISTKYATGPSGAYVDFISVPFKFGLGIPVTYKVTPTGYSFSGGLPVCTMSSVCTNGQKLVWHVNLTGEVKKSNSSDPDVMTYKYTVDVMCGNIWTCRESGTFQGTRKAGKAGTVEGEFYGMHEWNLQCCPTGHTPA